MLVTLSPSPEIAPLKSALRTTFAESPSILNPAI